MVTLCVARRKCRSFLSGVELGNSKRKELTARHQDDKTSSVEGGLKARTQTVWSVGGCLARLSSAVLLAVTLSLAPAGVQAATGTNSSKGQTSKANKSATKSHTASKHSKSKTTKSNANSNRSDQRRRAAMRPEPQRVQEIQRGLIEAGELHQEPTGRWDDSTRDAMKRYQQAHGFPVTGLPDAKSLMKMGLGAHPLPPDVETAAATRASLEPTATSALPAATSGDDPPATADPPRERR